MQASPPTSRRNPLGFIVELPVRAGRWLASELGELRSPGPFSYTRDLASPRRRPVDIGRAARGLLGLAMVLAFSAGLTIAATMAWGMGGLAFGLGFSVLIWFWTPWR